MINPLVSIIIPVYGVEDYIARCARSVFRQTYQNLEIIFVDDCTPDNSIGVLRQVMEEYPERKMQVKILKHEHNRGLSAARNTGIEAATGEYIYFLDSDDAITEDCIEKLTEPLKVKGYDFVVGNHDQIGKLNIGFHPMVGENGPLYGKQIFKSFFDKQWPVIGCNKLCNIVFLRKFHIYFREGQILEDALWSFELACMAASMYRILDNTYLYFIRGGSIMTSASSNVSCDTMINNGIHMWSFVSATCPEKVDNLKINYIVNNIILSTLLDGNFSDDRYIKYYLKIKSGIFFNYKCILKILKSYWKNIFFVFPFILPSFIGFKWFSFTIKKRRNRIEHLNKLSK